jgi:hypothetical protein
VGVSRSWTLECNKLVSGSQSFQIHKTQIPVHLEHTHRGGNVLRDNQTGLHHLYVTEIAGPNGTSCGLASWGSHSTIVHAVSKNGLAGPYAKASVAVGHEGHNPQAVRVGRKWVIFHIGGGSPPGTPISPCPTPPGPPPPSCDSFHSQSACPPKRCAWNGGKCTSVKGLCGTQMAPGYYCQGNYCSGATPSSGKNCGTYLSLPNLTCTKNCAAEVAALCDKDIRCHSFSLMNSVGGRGALHSQLFAGGGTCLRPNTDWTTFVKKNSRGETMLESSADADDARGEHAGGSDGNAPGMLKSPHTLIHFTRALLSCILSHPLLSCTLSHPLPCPPTRARLALSLPFHTRRVHWLGDPHRGFAWRAFSPAEDFL